MNLHRKVAITALATLILVGCTVTVQRLQAKLARAYDPEHGKYIDLKADLFSSKVIFTGVMDPWKFMDALGVSIFLDEPHRAGRIPVVLVHGHSTGPRPFQALADSLDREHFEPWFVFYPTGQDIVMTALTLRRELVQTCQEYDVDRVAFVSYSMGGLVTRETLKNQEDDLTLPQVPIYIGIAAPWGGSEESRFDSRKSLAPPSWKQLVPLSDFLVQLFDRPLPEETAFHMIYGLGGDDRNVPGADDGILSEMSLSRPEAVAEAASVTVCDHCTHKDIIENPEVISQVDDLLAGLLQEPQVASSE